MSLEFYIQNLFYPEDDLLVELRTEANERGLPQITIEPIEGQILQLLIRIIQAKKIIEIGTLFGYSAIWMGRALPYDGKLITLEHVAQHKELAEEYISRANLNTIIEVKLGEALELLSSISNEGPFDLCFIDADWDDYPDYLDWALRNVRVNGIIVGHNAYFFGFLALDPTDDNFELQLRDISEDAFIAYQNRDYEGKAAFRESLAAMRQFNYRMATDSRLRSIVLPTEEGMVIGMMVPK